MARREELPALSEAQLEIMNAIWDRGEATVADVLNDLSTKRSLARNTVQTMVTRLEEKGWLTHRTESGAFVFRATVERDAARRRIVRRLLDAAFGGSTEALMTALLKEEPVSAAEAERIRSMLAEAGRKKPR